MPVSYGDKVNKSPENKIIVACIGNSLAADDAVGCAVYEKLKKQPIKESTLVNLQLGGVALLEHLNGQELLIVVDAVSLGASPGHVHVLDWKNLPTYSGIAVSAHGLGLEDTVQIGQTLYPERMPQRVVLVGIEGKCFNQLGWDMSEEVRASVESAVATVCSIISSKQKGSEWKRSIH